MKLSPSVTGCKYRKYWKTIKILFYGNDIDKHTSSQFLKQKSKTLQSIWCDFLKENYSLKGISAADPEILSKLNLEIKLKFCIFSV